MAEPVTTWDAVVDGMFADLRAGSPRRQAYWAQQLAFGPALVHAVGLRLRAGPVDESTREVLGRCVAVAEGGLAALPELRGGDPAALQICAARQARALAWGRRSGLVRLRARLGASPQPADFVPSRMMRPYPLLGFRPGQRMSG